METERTMETDKRYRMEVKHRWSAPRRYTWEIFDGSRALPRFESRVLFLSREEASIAGKIALAEIRSCENKREWPAPWDPSL
jgi:hypothetical protein